VPDLCIEVLSTNRAFDRLTKRVVFASCGVDELWLVEPSGVVERWSGQGLNEAELVEDELTTPLLPGFALDVRALFRCD
jgi:Uma2 family endonuclease